MEPKESGTHDYLKDIETIKDVMIKAEDWPFFECWVFYVWGACIITGTLIQHFVGHLHEFTAGEQLLKIWLPVLVVLGFFEVVGLVRSLSRQAIRVFTKPVVRFYISLVGSALALILLIVLLHSAGDDELIPVAYVGATAVMYFLFSLGSYPHFAVHGYGMLAFGAVLAVFSFNYEALVLAAGIGIGLSFFAAGIADTLVRRKDQRIGE